MITTLIPAYKTEFLTDLFFGLKQQTFKQFKVIVSDDSPNNEVTALLRNPGFKPLLEGIALEIIQGPKQGATQNINHLTKHWAYSTPYVHLLLDDDIIYPLFYQLHILAHQKQNVGASASFRWIGNAKGNPTATRPVPLFVSNSDERIDLLNAEHLFPTMISTTKNWLGETSNVLFTAESFKYFEKTSINEINYYGLRDVGIYLQISLTKNIALIKDHLSVFRIHTGQDTGDLSSTTYQGAHLAWIALAIAGLETGKISINQAKKGIALVSDQKIAPRFPNSPKMQAFAKLHNIYNVGSEEFKSEFLSLWAEFLTNRNN